MSLWMLKVVCSGSALLSRDLLPNKRLGSAEAANSTKSNNKHTDGRTTPRLLLKNHKAHGTLDMEIDGAPNTTVPSKRSLRVEKRRSSSRKASIVFPKFKAGKRVGVKSKRS